jgi:hypothetical protein
MDAPLEITFGVEIECMLEFSDATFVQLTGGDPPKDIIWQMVFAAVYDELTEGGVHVKDPGEHSEQREDYARWSLKRDESIEFKSEDEDHPHGNEEDEEDENHMYNGSAHLVTMEIISRMLRRGSDAAEEIRKVIALVSKQFKMSVNPKMGLHVHVGCGSGELPLETVKKFAVLVLSVGKHLDTLHPTRIDNEYWNGIQDIIHDGFLRWLKPAERVNAIYSCADKAKLVWMMSPNGMRHYAYNFASLDDKHTIEFRQHAGSVDPINFQCWAMVATKLVEFAHEISREDLEIFTASANSDPSFTVFNILLIIWRGKPTGETLVKYYISKIKRQTNAQQEAVAAPETS